MNTARGVVVLCMGLDKGPAKRLWEDLNSPELAWAKITLTRGDPNESVFDLLHRATWEGPADAPVAVEMDCFANVIYFAEVPFAFLGEPPERLTRFPWPLRLVGYQRNGPAFYVREDAWPELAP